MSSQVVENLSKTTGTASYPGRVKTRVTSGRRIASIINMFALFPIIIGVAIILYGVGYALVNHTRHKSAPSYHGNPSSNYIVVERISSQFKTQNENQYQIKATEKGIHIANVGSIIFFFGISLIVATCSIGIAPKALSPRGTKK